MLTPKRFGSIRYLILVTVMRFYFVCCFFFCVFGYKKIYAVAAAAVVVVAYLLGKTGSILNVASGHAAGVVSRPKVQKLVA